MVVKTPIALWLGFCLNKYNYEIFTKIEMTACLLLGVSEEGISTSQYYCPWNTLPTRVVTGPARVFIFWHLCPCSYKNEVKSNELFSPQQPVSRWDTLAHFTLVHIVSHWFTLSLRLILLWFTLQAYTLVCELGYYGLLRTRLANQNSVLIIMMLHLLIFLSSIDNSPVGGPSNQEYHRNLKTQSKQSIQMYKYQLKSLTLLLY